MIVSAILCHVAAGQTPAASTPPKAADAAAFVPSRRLNLYALRALKKPVTHRRIDTFVGAGFIARDNSDAFWSRDYLTGNWGGVRDDLFKRGVDLYLFHLGDAYGVVDGGIRKSFRYNALTLAGVDIYTGPAQWWAGGQIHITAASIEGKSVGRDDAGALNSVYFADPVRFGTRLFEIWYGHKFAGGRAEFRIGTMFPYVRLASNMPSSLLTNTSFNYPTFLGSAPSAGLTAAYAAAPFGVQLSYNFSPEVYAITQISDGYQDVSGGFDNYRNDRVDLSRREGAEGMVEVGYRLNQRRDSTGLAGNYKLGVQFHTGTFENNHIARNGAPLALAGGRGRDERGNGAVYAMLDQMLTREADQGDGKAQGVTAFVKFAKTTSESVNQVSSHWAAGLEYEGLLPGRNHDVLAAGVSRTHFSDGIRIFDRDSLARNPRGDVRGTETVFELAYAAEIAPWWIAIGSYQRVSDPSGRASRADATVLGVSNRIAF